jgi:hypothetical protein
MTRDPKALLRLTGAHTATTNYSTLVLAEGVLKAVVICGTLVTIRQPGGAGFGA